MYCSSFEGHKALYKNCMHITGNAIYSCFSVNLEHNNMTSFSGLIYLENLRVSSYMSLTNDSKIPRPHQNFFFFLCNTHAHLGIGT